MSRLLIAITGGSASGKSRLSSALAEHFNQHDAQWIPDGKPGAGNMLVFSNGNTRPTGPSCKANSCFRGLEISRILSNRHSHFALCCKHDLVRAA